MELLSAALGQQNGDANIIKNTGAVIDNPYGDIVRSLLIAIFSLKVTKVLIVGHTDCGVEGLKSERILAQMAERGVHPNKCDIDISTWRTGFTDVYDSVRHSVRLLRQHPLIPSDVEIEGSVMDVATGEVHMIADDK